jgi:hypothetical protein
VVPPVAEAEAEPVPLEQVGCVTVRFICGAADVETMAEPDALQPFASVTVILYEPAAILVIVWVLPPLDHAYEYGAVPPLTIAEAWPFDAAQPAFTTPVCTESAVEGAEILTLDEVWQPNASVTVSEYVPAVRLFTEAEFEPFDHK